MTDSEADALRALLRRSGADQAARAEAEALCTRALDALNSHSIPPAVSTELHSIANYTIRRTL